MAHALALAPRFTLLQLSDDALRELLDVLVFDKHVIAIGTACRDLLRAAEECLRDRRARFYAVSSYFRTPFKDMRQRKSFMLMPTRWFYHAVNPPSGFVEVLAEHVIGVSSKLERFSCSAHDIIDEDAATALATAVSVSPSLTQLDLRNQRRVGVQGAKALAAAFGVCSSLAHVDLFNSNLGDQSAKALAAGLASSRSITWVSLSNNKIGDEGAKALAACLASNRSIKYLFLAYNNIGDEGAKALAASIDASRSLDTLTLHGNPRHWQPASLPAAP